MFNPNMTREELKEICVDIWREFSKLAKDCEVVDCDWDDELDDGSIKFFLTIEKEMYIHGTWEIRNMFDFDQSYGGGDLCNERMKVPSFKLTDFFPSLTNLPTQVGKYKLISAEVNNKDLNIDYDFDNVKNDESEFYPTSYEMGAVLSDAHLEGKGDVFADVGLWIDIVLDEN